MKRLSWVKFTFRALKAQRISYSLAGLSTIKKEIKDLIGLVLGVFWFVVKDLCCFPG